MTKCALCGNPATHQITDTKPVTSSCDRCLYRLIEYGRACVKLNSLVRQYSIPGSGVTKEDIKQASLEAVELSPHGFA